MDQLLSHLTSGNTPFCIIQKQDSEDILVLTGDTARYRALGDIPRKTGTTGGACRYDTISVIPFCQIRERGYTVHDAGEEILTIQVRSQHEVDSAQFIDSLPSERIRLEQQICYDTTEEEYGDLICRIVDREIGNGEGANFVVPRNGGGKIEDFSVSRALTIFKRLLENDYGTYWKFIFYDRSHFFIGSTPERHLLVQGGRVKMNPISGTFRKDRNWSRRKDFKKDLLSFLTDPKEINELFMVVDEELKMMAKMCDRGGSIVGPLLKEMSQLIHSEYLLSGESDKDVIELFTDSMFAATVVGSPVENACKVITRYSKESRRYYGSAMMLLGRDEQGDDFLDSPITIRTVEVDPAGKMQFSVGATLVKDSEPEEEVRETWAKGAAILSSIVSDQVVKREEPRLASLYNDDEIIETMVERNQNLSNFWFFRQGSQPVDAGGEQISITMVHNEDDFIYMLRHMFSCMGVKTTIVRYNEYDIDRDNSDLTLLGPGPGNPNAHEQTKIAINRRIAGHILERKRKGLFICLGHQILCSVLGFTVERKKKPLQGSQVKIDLFGREEMVGFYNTFAPVAPSWPIEFDLSTMGENKELIAIRGEHFVGYQFHPESLLTKNGYTILHEAVMGLVRPE